MSEPIIRIVDAKRHYRVAGSGAFGRKGRTVRAVDGVNLDVLPGKTLALVGESGSGKTSVLKLALGVENPDSGKVMFGMSDLVDLSPGERRQYRKSVQAVFQDPWASLNPRMRVETIVAEPLQFSGGLDRASAREKVRQALDDVGLGAHCLKRFPHEFSGGQRQRIAIARALALRPSLVVLDEPVSALDVSVRAQIINLLKELQDELGLAYFLVAHELATIWSLSDQVAVMYRGRIVEFGATELIRQRPKHPYTRALLEAELPLHPRMRQKRSVKWNGDALSVGAEGCRYQARCPIVKQLCQKVEPKLEVREGGHEVACHFS